VEIHRVAQMGASIEESDHIRDAEADLQSSRAKLVGRSSLFGSKTPGVSYTELHWPALVVQSLAGKILGLQPTDVASSTKTAS
jgi:hypothetical protein